MKTTSFSFRPAILVLLFVCLISYACSRVEDNTRSGTLLEVTNVVGDAGGNNGEISAPLLSDTCDNDDADPQDPDLCTVFNDNANLTFRNQYLMLGPGVGFTPTPINDVIVNRYRVDYFRANSRNIPGVDVPFGIDGTMNVRVPIGTPSNPGTGLGSIIVVRHVAKKEPPLAELDNGTSELLITANAELRFWGQDIAGRTVSATGYLEIHFANYGE